MSQHFSKDQRLRQAKDFDQLRRVSRKKTIHPLVFYYAKNQLNTSRIGFSISSKLLNAVHRNKIKRQLRDLYRKDQTIHSKCFDILVVVIAKSEREQYRDSFKKFVEFIHE